MDAAVLNFPRSSAIVAGDRISVLITSPCNPPYAVGVSGLVVPIDAEWGPIAGVTTATAEPHCRNHGFLESGTSHSTP